MIVDAQSVKNTDTAKHKGYDAGKKISGIKRHIAVDTEGLPHAIAVTTADITDRKGALEAFEQHKHSLGKVASVLVDGGYTGRPFAEVSIKFWGRPYKLPSAMNSTPLVSCLSGGWWNALLPGLRNAIAFGKTVSDN